MEIAEKTPLTRAITNFVYNAPVIYEKAKQVVLDAVSILQSSL